MTHRDMTDARTAERLAGIEAFDVLLLITKTSVAQCPFTELVNELADSK